jgi:hypothetical protein
MQIDLKKSALEQNEKTHVETVEAAPMVFKENHTRLLSIHKRRKNE